jgi:hypothetical protein
MLWSQSYGTRALGAINVGASLLSAIKDSNAKHAATNAPLAAGSGTKPNLYAGYKNV